jgi:hypothetical protein
MSLPSSHISPSSRLPSPQAGGASVVEELPSALLLLSAVLVAVVVTVVLAVVVSVVLAVVVLESPLLESSSPPPPLSLPHPIAAVTRPSSAAAGALRRAGRGRWGYGDDHVMRMRARSHGRHTGRNPRRVAPGGIVVVAFDKRGAVLV